MAYTYVYFDQKLVPFYVGQGSKIRYMRKHLHIPLPKQVLIFSQDVNGREMTEQDAQDLEWLLITSMGRQDLGTGPLLNRVDGGAGCLNPSVDIRKRISAASVRTIKLHGSPQTHEGSVKGGTRSAELHGSPSTPEGCSKGGRIGGPISGRIAVESGQLASLRTPEHQSKAGRLGGLYAVEHKEGVHAPGVASMAGKKSCHVRWHVNTGVTSPDCTFCQAGAL